MKRPLEEKQRRMRERQGRTVRRGRRRDEVVVPESVVGRAKKRFLAHCLLDRGYSFAQVAEEIMVSAEALIAWDRAGRPLAGKPFRSIGMLAIDRESRAAR